MSIPVSSIVSEAQPNFFRPAYLPELDGLRGGAALALVFYHAQLPFAAGIGQAGMELFFTLSGFLVTNQLLNEYSQKATINLKNFYYRRAKRLLPNLIASVLVLDILALVVAFPGSDKSFLWSVSTLTFTLNWVSLYFGEVAGLYDGAWSLAIEAQFYFVSPFCILFLLKSSALNRRSFLSFTVGLVMTALMVRFYIALNDQFSLLRLRDGTDTRMIGFICGGIAAGTLRNLSLTPKVFHQIILDQRTSFVLAALAIACVMVTQRYTKVEFVTTWLMIPVLSSGMMLSFAARSIIQASPCIVSQALSTKIARWLGKISYSLYLWHGLVLWLLGVGLEKLNFSGTVIRGSGLTLGVIISLGVAWLCWRYVESPFYSPAFRQ